MDTKQLENLPLEEMKKLFLYLGKLLVESTDTTLDDKFYNFIKTILNDEDNSFINLIKSLF